MQYIAPNEELVLDMHRFYEAATGSRLEIQGTNDVDVRWDEGTFQLHVTAKKSGLFDLPIRATTKDAHFSTVLTLASAAGTGGHTFKFKPSEKPAKVAVAGAFNGWSLDKNQLAVGPDGTWAITLPLKPGRYGYKFVVDGKWTLDPENSQTEDNGLGDKNSVLIIPGDPAGVAPVVYFDERAGRTLALRAITSGKSLGRASAVLESGAGATALETKLYGETIDVTLPEHARGAVRVICVDADGHRDSQQCGRLRDGLLRGRRSLAGCSHVLRLYRPLCRRRQSNDHPVNDPHVAGRPIFMAVICAGSRQN